jgi:hypothetical protein
MAKIEIGVDLRLAADGTGITGIAFDSVGLDIIYSVDGGTVTPFTPTVDDWFEIGSGAYRLLLPKPPQSLTKERYLMAVVNYPDAMPSKHSVRVGTLTPHSWGV